MINRKNVIQQIAILFFLLVGSIGAAEPYGIDAMLRLDRLPYLSSDISAGQTSSYERSGGNGDAGNNLYSISGENVLLDLQGAGAVYCIWTTGYNYGTELIKAYIDGESTARLNMVMQNFFAGTNAPFLSPLAGNDAVSSGGFYSYVPLPFSKSIRMTSTGSRYYHIGYHTYAPDAAITPWSQTVDVSAARTMWQRCGTDPKPAVTATTATSTATVDSAQEVTLLDINGPRSITSIKIKIPELGTIGQSGQNPSSVTDNGRAFTGYSRFTVAIDPTNQGIRLKRRLDYGIADQKANISVDGAAAGQWFTAGSDNISRWRDSSFSIASSLTSGKSSITITVTFVSAGTDWNEFFYWVYSKGAGGAEDITDTVDVGNAASEAGHSYTITTQTWTGTQTFQYPGGVVTAPLDILNNLSLRIYWDNESSPSVDAPIGSFFAMGQFGGYPTRSLMLGADSANNLYCYFPMPFLQHGKITLASKRVSSTANIAYEINHAPFTDAFDRVGYFKAKFNHAIHAGNDGADVLYLDTTGSGKFLGITYSMKAPNNTYLEGDERFYVDNNRTPVFHGTGTEDLFNGGWYFNQGRFTLPQHGAPVVSGTNNACYRFFLHDAVTFRTHIRASIEHGGTNDQAVETWSVAYYYQKPQASALFTDSIDIGNSASETAHSYASGTPTFSGSRTSTFEGEFDKTSITETGKSISDSSAFTVSIVSPNRGVILRRMFDHIDQKQSAEVFIDGAAAGMWYHAGSNSTHRWREDEFLAPEALTNNKNQIRITLRHTAGTPDWSEFKYWAITLIDTAGASSISPRRGSLAIKQSEHSGNPGFVSIYSVNGRLLRRMEATTIDLRSQLPHGVYLMRHKNGSAASSRKIVIE